MSASTAASDSLVSVRSGKSPARYSLGLLQLGLGGPALTHPVHLLPHDRQELPGGLHLGEARDREAARRRAACRSADPTPYERPRFTRTSRTSREVKPAPRVTFTTWAAKLHRRAAAVRQAGEADLALGLLRPVHHHHRARRGRRPRAAEPPRLRRPVRPAGEGASYQRASDVTGSTAPTTKSRAGRGPEVVARGSRPRPGGRSRATEARVPATSWP